MMKGIRIWAAVSGVIAAAAGAALHFTHDVFGEPAWAAVSAVNESTWEHLKLIYWPAAAMTLIEYIFYGRKLDGFLTIRTVSVLAGMAAVVTAFYTYRGVLGYSFMAADAAVFIFGVTVLYSLSCALLTGGKAPAMVEKDPGFFSTCAFSVMVSLAMLFMLFTYAPPHIGLFMDPLTETYGIKQ